MITREADLNTYQLAVSMVEVVKSNLSLEKVLQILTTQTTILVGRHELFDKVVVTRINVDGEALLVTELSIEQASVLVQLSIVETSGGSTGVWLHTLERDVVESKDDNPNIVVENHTRNEVAIKEHERSINKLNKIIEEMTDCERDLRIDRDKFKVEASSLSSSYDIIYNKYSEGQINMQNLEQTVRGMSESKKKAASGWWKIKK